MTEIIILYYLCKKIGKIALNKGLNAGRWKLYTVLSFLGAEIVGIGFGVALFGQNDLLGLGALGLISAFGGYLIIKVNLDKMPDTFDDDVDKIGINDLQPPRKD